MQALNAVPDGRQPKNGFDLSNFETFSQKGGMLNIVGVRDTVPNSDYKMAVDAFTRTLPCNTANFAHIKENYYFVHVPLGLISRNAYQTLVQRKQAYTALDMGISQFPTFELTRVLNRCLEIAHLDLTLEANEKFKDVHGFNIGRQAFRLFDMLGYGCYLDIVESTFKESGGLTVAQAQGILSQTLDGYKPTANRLAAYQCVWYHFFRNDIYDCEVSAKSFNFDDVTYQNNDTSSYDILDYRNIDDFIVQCCQLRYVGHKKDLFMGAMPGTQFGAVSSINMNVDFDDLTAQFVGNAVTPTFTGTSSQITGEVGVPLNSNGNPWTPVIESDYGKWEYEDVSQNGMTGGYVTADFPLQIKRGVDYNFTDNGNGTNDIHDGAVGVTLGGNAYHNHQILEVNASHVHKQHGSITPQGTISSITPSGSVVLSGQSTTGTSFFDVIQLVQAQAIQKWRQKSMLAGNKTADQFRAHHGEVPRHLIDHLPDFIGSVDNEIQITEITSQADTATSADESNLGEIAGRGYGASNNKVFHFHSDDYGILLLLHAIVPENTYSSFGLDFGNTMVYYNDFFQSEYANIGLRAVPMFLLNALDSLGVPQSPDHGHGTEGFTADVGAAGFAPANFNYKQYVSKVHGMFNPSRLALFDQGVVSRFGFSDMQSFVIARQDLVLPLNTSILQFGFLEMTLSMLYVHPSLFDSIFAVNADDSEQTDEFITHAKFYCEALLPMPVLGLPQF